MKISIIVPTNNIKNINSFIMSLDKMTNFKRHIELVIIGNGNVYYDGILGGHRVLYDFIRVNEDYKDKIVPFAKLRWEGMKWSKCDYFLFMDDDNIFTEECDDFFIKCVNTLTNNKIIGTLQAERTRDGKSGIRINNNGFFWTGYGLFIKNNIKYNEKFKNFKGCCEETLFAYESLDISGIPYIIYGNPIIRDRTKTPKWNQFNNPSYSEEIIQENIQGYIQEKYDDKDWKYYNNIPNNVFPKLLQEKINSRIIK